MCVCVCLTICVCFYTPFCLHLIRHFVRFSTLWACQKKDKVAVAFFVTEKFIRLYSVCGFPFAEEDYDQFCLAYMFTYRDFEMGTLGLAWTGDLKNAGGVCEKNGVSCASDPNLSLPLLSVNAF